jgi:hypothetical protein
MPVGVAAEIRAGSRRAAHAHLLVSAEKGKKRRSLPSRRSLFYDLATIAWRTSARSVTWDHTPLPLGVCHRYPLSATSLDCPAMSSIPRSVLKEGYVDAAYLEGSAHREHMLDSEQLLAQTSPTSVFDKLPPELLAQVFFLLRPSSWAYGMKSKDQFASPLATFLWPTQVCSAWRSAALACATLWNLLPGPTPEITQYMLDRSAHAPLMVVLEFPTDLLISDLPLLLTQMHRIQCLELRGILNNNELQAVYS